MLDNADVVMLFLEGAGVIAGALADVAVADAWDQPSVLEDQLVGGLAGHLARGGVWVVGDYLDAGVPDRPPDFATAGEYFAGLVSAGSADSHRAIRARGAEIAAAGRDDMLRVLGERLAHLAPRLRSLDVDQHIAVVGGMVLRVEDYLVTRVVEQVVHLDDLARSVDHEPWPLPAEALELTIEVGADIAGRRHGSTAVVRALYRKGFAEQVLPVL